MADIFLKIVNMSISAGWLILVVLVLRLLLKKAPKWITVCLWGIVAVRLAFPFSIESIVSLIPSGETVSPQIVTAPVPQINTGVPVVNEIVNPVISESFAPAPTASANPLQILIPIAGAVWLFGVAVLLGYSAVSYLRLRKKISTAVLLRENIFQNDAVVSPFVLGIFKPRIYLPFCIDGQEMDYVMAHEQAHIRRGDHIWKPLGFLLLSLHWFNPLVWLGYVLLCRDIELACDEKVVKGLSTPQQADYAQALLDCSVNRRRIGACPLAFGETGVKNRIKSVLRYKKPAFWLVFLAVLVGVATAVCFLTDPIDRNKDDLLLRVLNNEKTFITESGERVCLQDYVLSGVNLKVTPKRYTLLDLDGDGTKELVVYTDPGRYGAYLVFHVYRNRVYGFEFAEKDMQQLKTDGTFMQREGTVTRYVTLRFKKTKYEVLEQAYQEVILQNEANNAYRIGGETVTTDSMSAYTQAFADKESVKWTPYKDTVIDEYRDIYMEFFERPGRPLAYEGGSQKSLGQYIDTSPGFEIAYTFYDMTDDGIPELCIRDANAVHFFTVKDGRLCHWYSRDAHVYILNNGALRCTYENGGFSESGKYIVKERSDEYYELDANASVKFCITYAWYDQNSNQGQDSSDLYEVNGKTTSKEEYDKVAEQYGKIGSNDIEWHYYGSIV